MYMLRCTCTYETSTTCTFTCTCYNVHVHMYMYSLLHIKHQQMEAPVKCILKVKISQSMIFIITSECLQKLCELHQTNIYLLLF